MEPDIRQSTSYRQKCSQVWLLMVANGFEPSMHCELAPEVEGFQFETDFDRVFFLPGLYTSRHIISCTLLKLPRQA
jgi:hypothetical protein